MTAKLTVDEGGKIALPDAVRDRYQLGPDTPVRIIETRGGILLVPLTNEPMSDELRRELEEWQSLSASALNQFAYQENEGRGGTATIHEGLVKG